MYKKTTQEESVDSDILFIQLFKNKIISTTSFELSVFMEECVYVKRSTSTNMLFITILSQITRTSSNKLQVFATTMLPSKAVWPYIVSVFKKLTKSQRPYHSYPY